MNFSNLLMFKVTLICTIFLISVDAIAFDGQRKGFIIGFGIGPGFSTYKQTVEIIGYGSESARENTFGFQTDFKIGYAPSNNLEIYYSNKVSWFGIENIMGDNITIANGLSSIATSYFFNQEGPSPFVSGGAGLAAWNPVFEEDADPWRGFGLFIGGGYEFSKHWDVSANIIWGNPSKTENSVKVNSNSLSFQITINVMGY